MRQGSIEIDMKSVPQPQGNTPSTLTEKFETAIARLYEAGARFVLCHSDKAASQLNWQNKRPKVRAVLSHLKREGNLIGIVPSTIKTLAVDVDQGGLAAVEAVKRRLKVKPLALVKTQRAGGFHVYFEYEGEGLGNRNWELPEGGGEIRHNKGYVILWGNDAAQAVSTGFLVGGGPVDRAAVDALTRRSTPTPPSGKGSATIAPDQLAPILDRLDVRAFGTDEDWFSLMCACHEATGGKGGEVFNEWSLSDPEYSDNGAENRTRWGSLTAGKEGNAGIGTLNKILSEHGQRPIVTDFQGVEDLEGLADPGVLPAIQMLSEYGGAIKTKWIWDHRIPIGHFTMLVGDPGVGKSLAMLDIAAAGTVGRALPGVKVGEQFETLWLGQEDAIRETVRPRFDLAGGDPTKLLTYDPSRASTLTDALTDYCLKVLVDHPAVKLIVLDTISAWQPSGDQNEGKFFREAEQILRRLLPGRAVVILHHTRKAGGSAIDKVAGNRQAVAFARHVLYMSGETLAVAKSNLGPKDVSVDFSITGPDPGKIIWGDVGNTSADDVASDDTSTRKDRAVPVLTELLQSSAGLMESDELLKRAGARGISRSAAFEAKKEMGIEAIKLDRKWYWSLPTQD